MMPHASFHMPINPACYTAQPFKLNFANAAGCDDMCNRPSMLETDPAILQACNSAGKENTSKVPIDVLVASKALGLLGSNKGV